MENRTVQLSKTLNAIAKPYINKAFGYPVIDTIIVENDVGEIEDTTGVLIKDYFVNIKIVGEKKIPTHIGNSMNHIILNTSGYVLLGIFCLTIVIGDRSYQFWADGERITDSEAFKELQRK